MAAFSPEPHTLFTVVALTVGGIPLQMPAWRAGACPSPACTTLPIRTSSISDGSIPARSTAALTATEPSLVAGTLLNAPRNLPIGVRTALRMTASVSLLMLSPLARNAAIIAVPSLLGARRLRECQQPVSGLHLLQLAIRRYDNDPSMARL